MILLRDSERTERWIIETAYYFFYRKGFTAAQANWLSQPKFWEHRG